MSRIFVVGSLNMDQTIRVERLPRPGETVGGGALSHTPGGKGANQAIAAARFAGPLTSVEMVGMVGPDQVGHEMVDTLAGGGVDVSRVKIAEGASSGVAIITVDASGENTIVLSPGANHLWPGGFTDEVPFGRGDYVLCQLEIPAAAVETVVARAANAGAVVVLNAAPPEQVTDKLLSHVDVLVVNEHEARVVLGAAPSLPEDLDALRPELSCEVIVTLGARGALVRPVGAPCFAVPAFAVESVSSVGAGDAFVGALVASLSAGRDLAEAAVRACAAGALATTVAGARGFVATADAVEELVGRQLC